MSYWILTSRPWREINTLVVRFLLFFCNGKRGLLTNKELENVMLITEKQTLPSLVRLKLKEYTHKKEYTLKIQKNPNFWSITTKLLIYRCTFCIYCLETQLLCLCMSPLPHLKGTCFLFLCLFVCFVSLLFTVEM